MVLLDAASGTCTRDVCWGPRERARRDSRQVACPKYIKGESCGPDSVTKLQQWNLVDVSTPVTPNTATYDCPWSPFGMGKDKPCTTDRDCTWLGSPAGMCSKCHKIPGARAICGPTK